MIISFRQKTRKHIPDEHHPESNALRRYLGEAGGVFSPGLDSAGLVSAGLLAAGVVAAGAGGTAGVVAERVPVVRGAVLVAFGWVQPTKTTAVQIITKAAIRRMSSLNSKGITALLQADTLH